MTPRKLLADSVLIGLPVLISRAIGLFMLPVYTRAFSPADLGFVETLVVLLAFFQIFSTLEAGQALARFLPESKARHRQGELISATLGIFVVGAAIVLGFSAFFAPLVLELFGIPPQYTAFLPYVALYLVAAQIFYFSQLQFIYRFEAKKSALVNFTASLLIAATCLALFLGEALTVKSFLLAQSVGYLCGMLLSMAFLYIQGIRLTLPSTVECSALLKYSWPLLVSSTAVILASSFDKVLISKLIGLNELGYYSVATRLAAIASIAFQVLGNVITPYLFSPDSEANARKTLSHIFGATSVGTLALTMFLTLFPDDIARLIASESYAGSAHYLAPAFLIAITANLYRFFPDMDIFKRTRAIAAINILACGAGGGIAFATVDHLGAFGIILGRFASAFGMSMLYCYFSCTMKQHLYTPSTLIAMAVFPISYLLWWVATSP